MHRTVISAAAITLTMLALFGCTDDSRGGATGQPSPTPTAPSGPVSTAEVAALATSLGATGTIQEWVGGWATVSPPGEPKVYVLKDATNTWFYGGNVSCDMSRTPNARFICKDDSCTAGARPPGRPDPTRNEPRPEVADDRCTNAYPPDAVAVSDRSTLAPIALASLNELRISAGFDPLTTTPEPDQIVKCGARYAGPESGSPSVAFDVCSSSSRSYAAAGQLRP